MALLDFAVFHEFYSNLSALYPVCVAPLGADSHTDKSKQPNLVTRFKAVSACFFFCPWLPSSPDFLFFFFKKANTI